jgi:rSAM/selenodomain-associated transferase 1
MNTQNALIIFIKTPQPFLVKTRLQPQISGEESALLYTAFLGDINRRFNAVEQFDCWYSVVPENYDEDLIKWFINPDYLLFQSGHDLGERMLNSFESLFNHGYKKIALIGSDIPTLPLGYVHAAFDHLKDRDCVIGPSLDGGYYLLALRSLQSVLFEGIEWSKQTVFSSTVNRFNNSNLSYEVLPELQDIDSINELTDLYRQLKTADQDSIDFPRDTWNVLTRLFSDGNIDSNK